ncbi:MAG: hypothetical protein EBR82_75830 [Caulobacteraceae bacterium]|nr:hypothetical protein [Caulobacteraceae bacterium]
MDNKSKEPFGFNEVSTGELIDSPKFQEELSKKNTLLESLNSPEMVKMREDFAKARQDSIDKSVGWYYNLSSEEKYKAVEALCHIICKAEREGTSYRGLQSILGLYPEAFFIDDLMTLHNALYVEFQEQDSRNWKELKKDMKTLEETTSETGT